MSGMLSASIGSLLSRCQAALRRIIRSSVTSHHPPFRDAAVQDRYAARDRRRALRTLPPRAWSMFVAATIMIVALAAAVVVVPVESVTRAPAVIHGAGGTRVIVAPVNGTVVATGITARAAVADGVPLLRIRPVVHASVLANAERKLAIARRDYAEMVGLDRTDGQVRSLRARARLAADDIIALERAVGACRDRLAAYAELAANGLASNIQVANEQDVCDQRERAVGLARQHRIALEQEVEALLQQRDIVQLAARRSVREAQNEWELLVGAALETVSAPAVGVVDRLLVRPGDVVRDGEVVARILSAEPPFRVVCYVAERHRASLKPGVTAFVELAQFPFRRYGAARARVVRVSQEIASDEEVRASVANARSDGVAMSRVELELVFIPNGIRAEPGMTGDVRFRLRHEPLISRFME